MNKFNVPLLLGTGRAGRLSEKVAKFVLEQANIFGFDTALVDVRDYSTPMTVPPWEDNPDKKTWQKIMAKANGLIIVLPEYNHSFPGEFKVVFDQLLDEYENEPVAVCGVSSGGFGGLQND